MPILGLGRHCILAPIIVTLINIYLTFIISRALYSLSLNPYSKCICYGLVAPFYSRGCWKVKYLAQGYPAWNYRSWDANQVMWAQELILFITGHGGTMASTKSNILPVKSVYSRLFPHPNGYCWHPPQGFPGTLIWNLQLRTQCLVIKCQTCLLSPLCVSANILAYFPS